MIVFLRVIFVRLSLSERMSCAKARTIFMATGVFFMISSGYWSFLTIMATTFVSATTLSVWACPDIHGITPTKSPGPRIAGTLPGIESS